MVIHSNNLNFEPLTEQFKTFTSHLANMKNSTFTRSEVLSLAWAIRKQTSLPWGHCQVLAWRSCRLRSALHAGAVSFAYTKEDGTTRTAVGTLSPALFQYESKGSAHKQPSPLVIKYFDLEKQAFRSFHVERLTAA